MGIVIKVRQHGYKTGSLTYDRHDQAVLAVETAAVGKDTAVQVVHRELFAYIGIHPGTGRRFAVWRGRDRKE